MLLLLVLPPARVRGEAAPRVDDSGLLNLIIIMNACAHEGTQQRAEAHRRDNRGRQAYSTTSTDAKP